jgi:uncharacterized protein (TIGR00725 family)
MSVAEPVPPLRIAVVGAAAASAADRELAKAVGRALGEAGAVVVCGGGGGVMEAAARGCHEGGGITVGILPGPDAAGANAWVTLPLATGMGEARNALVVRGAEAVLAVGGQWGTLSEIALAAKMGIPVGLLGTPPAHGLGLPSFEGPGAAVRWAIEQARARRTNA